MNEFDTTDPMILDIQQKVESSRNMMRDFLNQRAEQYAEEYVAAQGLEDSEDKEVIKKQYIDEFIERMIKII